MAGGTRNYAKITQDAPIPFSTFRHNLVISVVKNRELIIICSSSVSCLVSQYFMDSLTTAPILKIEIYRQYLWTRVYILQTLVTGLACVANIIIMRRRTVRVCGRSVLPCSTVNRLSRSNQIKPCYICTDCPDGIRTPPCNQRFLHMNP